METEELMIGDWVKVCPLSHRLESKPSEVIMIGVDWVKTSEGSYDEELIEPLPLTEEILKANGWLVSMYSTLQLPDGKWLEYYHHEHRLRMWWKGVDEWENHSEQKELCFQCECHYVHQIQHALRLCGLTELTDNFKIE